MVLEGYAKMITDIVKFSGINVPNLAGQVHGAAKWNTGGL